MKKMWKRILATAMAACMTVGLMATGAGAYSWETESDSMGEMLQPVVDYENAFNSIYVVQLLPVGSVIEFSEPVDVSIYAEGEYGAFAPKPVTEDVTSYTIADALHTYIFTGADGGRAMFRGAASQQAPITLVGDLEYNSCTLELSKPVVDITVASLEQNYWGEESSWGNYIVYEVPVGTTVSLKSGSSYGVMLCGVWNADGTHADDYDTVEHFPDAEYDEDMGMLFIPLTLNDVGYYYNFAPEAVACSLPIFKVVDEEPAAYTPRTAEFTDMNWSKSFVEKVYGYGWMEGMGGGKFEPNGNLTIAQAITLAARIHSAKANRPIPTTEGAWYQSYVDYCMNNNLLYNYMSYEEGWELADQMDKQATRLDMVKILGAVANVPSLGWYEEETVTVPDVNKDEVEGGWLVYDWYRAGIVAGDPGTGNFRPNSSITRGEVAVILCNLLGL